MTARLHSSVIFASGMSLERTETGYLAKKHFGNIRIGANTYIGPYTVIHRARIKGRYTEIADNCQIGSLNNIGHHVKIGSRVVITQGVLLGGSCEIDEGCFVAMGAMVLPHVKIGPNNMIGAGAVVTRDIEGSWGVYYGSPAKRMYEWEGEWR